ncbi:MAG: MFS transporter [Terricaulis sp.]|nr:MFS transporter [Terricaulis sp.]
MSNRNYAIYSAGNAISLTGTWIHGIAFAWFAWELTRSAFWLGVLGTVGLAPTLFAGLIGGVLADRIDRLRLTIMTQIMCFLLSMTLFVLFSFNLLNIWLLIIFKVLVAIFVALSQPARMALIPNLVGPKMIGPAVSFGSMVFNSARFIGPAVAGIVISIGGVGPAFLINAFSYLAFAAAIIALKLPPEVMRPAAPAEKASFLQHVGGSFSYLKQHQGALTLFVLMIFVVVFARPISDFLPAIVAKVFNRGVEGVAFLTSSIAAGSLLGGLWMAGRDVKGLTNFMIGGAIAYAVCIIAFVTVTHFWAGCALFATAGFCTSVFATSAQTLVQTSVDDSVRGRIMSLWFIISRGGPDLGAFFMGVGGELIGLQGAFIIGCLICMGMSLWTFTRRKPLAAQLEVTRP